MKKSFKIGKEGAGERLDAWLAKRLPGVSRSRIQKWIKAGEVLRNGSADTPHVILEEGDKIAVDAPDAPSAGEPLAPRHDIALDVVHEDEHVAVVNKPAGLIVHPAVPGETETLANALVARYPEIAAVGDSPERPGIVHRLDKEASGLLVVARTAVAFANLKAQFQAHVVKKEYAVLIDGAAPEDSGTIRLAIGRSSSGGKMAARPDAGEDDKDAITHYRVEERFPKATYLTVRTETGRTHQIRAHFHALGCPVVGDPLYGAKKTGRLPSPRLFLHAKTLAFTHPVTDEQLSFSSPLPKELEDVLSGLRRK
ncbi:MAG: hypothetical protein RL272_55 [Candidatus Parcubacteria bacterium]|jgi:23S rRNA pseudouridine1911/1915/1917 synthase